MYVFLKKYSYWKYVHSMYVGISRAKVQIMVSLSLRLLGVVGIKAPPKVPVKMATQTSNKDA